MKKIIFSALALILLAGCETCIMKEVVNGTEKCTQEDFWFSCDDGWVKGVCPNNSE